MKTRLLALVLACMMVLSVVPVVTASAATTCPYASAIDGDHTLASANGTAIYLETVRPQCGGRWGHDLFKCAGCGEHFADNFVRPANNAHDLELADKGTPSTCVVPGRSAKYACLNCDYTEGGVRLPLAAHNYAPVDGGANDCTGARKCTVCGLLAPATPHDWKMVESTVVKPYLSENGELINGVATYACTRCEVTKNVVIIAEHDCTLEKVEAVTATCESAGNIEYWECTHPNCNRKYDAAGFPLTDEQVVIPASHVWAEDPNIVEATCTTWGYVFYGCLYCGATKTTETTAPYGHTTFDDPTSTNCHDTFAECQADGLRTWNCGRCGEAQELVVEAHTLYTAEFAATCARYAYKFQYCTICTPDHGSTFEYEGIAYDLAVPTAYDEQGHVTARELYKVVGAVEINTEAGLNAEAHHWVVADTNAPTCFVDGDKVWYCDDCQRVFYTEVVLAYHKVPQGEPVADVAATCTTDAYKSYLCAHCGMVYSIVEANTATGHPSFEAKETVKPTCYTKGYTVYQCTACDYTEHRDVTDEIQYVLGTFFSEVAGDNSYAEMEAYSHIFEGYYADSHPNATLEGVHIQGNCEKLGLYRYWCNDCRTYILVAMSGTGLGHRNDVDADGKGIYNTALGELAPVEATCTTDGVNGKFICANNGCGILVDEAPIVSEKTGHAMTKVTEIPDGKCRLDYWVCANCNNLFLDEAGSRMVSEFLTHNFVITDRRTVSCEKFGYNHYECQNCNSVEVEYIKEFVDALDHNYVLVSEGVDPTCSLPGRKPLQKCDRACCDILTGKVHPVDNGAYIPALGLHKNAEGRTFTDWCTDTETDRFCVLCNNTIGKNHTYGTPSYVDPTCQDYGHYLYVCDRYNECGHHYIEYDNRNDNVEDGQLGQHRMGEWHVSSDNSNMMVRECVYGCGYTETRQIADVEYFAEVQNVLGNVGYTDSSLITVAIKVKADSPLWGLRFDVKYDNNLTFIGYNEESVSGKFSDGFAINKNADNSITIAAGATSADNKPTNVTIEGKETLVVLNFRIDLPLNAAGLPVVGIAKTSSTITVEPIDTLNKDHRDLIAKGDVETIEILPFMDVNLDGNVNMNDALYMYEILRAGSGYKVVLDIDQNGAIEYADYVALYQYLVHAWSYEYMTQLGSAN